MNKLTMVAGAALLILGLGVFVWSGNSASEHDAVVSAFDNRLLEARSATGDDSIERMVEGTVQSKTTTKTPAGRPDVVVWAEWTNVRVSAGSHIYRAKDLSFGSAPFEVQTPEGPLVVDGTVRGASDLVRREQVPGKYEIAISPGDLVTVLGTVSKRDGQSGFFGDVIVVKGSYAQWRDVFTKASVGSIPDQP